MPIQLTERTKDRILDVLLVVSILLFIFGVVTPSVPRRAEHPPRAVYSPPRLAQMNTDNRPQFDELQPVATSSPSQKKSTAAATTSSSVTPAATAPATSPAPAQQAVAPSRSPGVGGLLTGVLRLLF